MNLFVGYACNLRCPYCFAGALQTLYPHRISEENFEKFFAWCVRTGLSRLAFIGGEPTLHPRLADMVERAAEARIAVSVFTNGLGRPALMDRLGASAAQFIVNYNPPELLSSGERRRLRDNLLLMGASGARLVFSKNFSPRYADYAYLLEGIVTYEIPAVRYDISRPDLLGSNDFAPPEAMSRLLAAVTAFVERCAALGVSTGMDCCLRMCDTEPEQRAFLERVSAKFTGICHPSLDVHPDLSVSYCLPLHDLRVPDVTAFSGEEALRWHFAEAARPIRERNAAGECRSCKDFMRRCQGGCLAGPRH
ncbi:MAG: radical SAM protein [Desulfovibrio sp.]|nr:radical SAM protein [Desulfovibrio sp.]